MKIIIFKKKKIIISIVIMWIIISFLYCIIGHKQNQVEAFEYNTNLSLNAKNKIVNLVNGKEKIAYLTFDDGPNKIVTPKVLDILKKKM